MSKLILILMLAFAGVAKGQNVDSAGVRLQKSANFSIAAPIVLGLAALVAPRVAKDIAANGSSTLTPVLVILYGAAAFCEGEAIYNIWRAGKYMRK